MGKYFSSSKYSNNPQWYNDYKKVKGTDTIPVESFITDDMLAKWEQMEKEDKERRSATIRSEVDEFERTRDNLLEFFSSNSKEYKYISKVRYPYPFSFCYSVSEIKKAVEKYRAAIIKEKVEAAEKADKAIYVGEAIQYLISKGKVLNVDFDIDNAVDKATQLAFDDFSSKWFAENTNKDVFFDFYGNNCEGPCKGWNPGNHRCECGNRRITAYPEGDFKNQYMVKEAY